MFTTADYLKQDPWEALIAIVNQKYRLDLNSATTKLVAFTPGVGTQTSVTLAAKRSTGAGSLLPAFTERTFTYDRLDLSAYFGADPIVLTGVRPPVSTHALTTQLATTLGIQFDQNDFINEIILTDTELMNYELMAHPRSLRWVGSVRFTGLADKLDLAGLATVSAPQALHYSHDQDGKIEAPHYLMPYDFTAFRRELITLRPDSLALPPQRLAAILNIITTGPEEWDCRGVADEWNLAMDIVQDVAWYKVLYNGPVTLRWSPRDEMRYVLVLELHPELCTNMAGHLLLHYR